MLGILKEMTLSQHCLSRCKVEIFTQGISGKYNLHRTRKSFDGRFSAAQASYPGNPLVYFMSEKIKTKKTRSHRESREMMLAAVHCWSYWLLASKS